MYAQKRDDNEEEILQYLTQNNIGYLQMDRLAGFDLLVLIKGGLDAVEIKNPERKWKLTKREQATKDLFEYYSVPYHIVETIEDITRVLKEG